LKRKRIIYVQYTNPAGYPPLEHSSQILAENGWDVLFLGTGALGADKLRFDEYQGIRVLRMRFQSPGMRQKLHYVVFHLWCLMWFLRWRPDGVYFSDLQSCPLGLLASCLGMRTIFHEHDVPSPGSGLFARCLQWSRNQFARRASLCVVPNAKRGEHLVASTGAPHAPAAVWNCPRTLEVSPPRAGLDEGNLRLLYHGSIVPDRLPLTVIEALASLPAQVTLTVVGYETVGAKGYVDAIQKRARELGIAERLRIVGTLATRAELISTCRLHDVGLSLMPLESNDPNMGSMAGASNKPYDYLACGLALLVSSRDDWQEMFVKPGYGLSCNPSSPESVAASLGMFAAQPEMARTMGERGRQRVMEEWNYEHQFRPVLELLGGSGQTPSKAFPRTAADWKSKAIR
jgi:glycosyltransferase involved in cell wall biosynthesis